MCRPRRKLRSGWSLSLYRRKHVDMYTSFSHPKSKAPGVWYCWKGIKPTGNRCVAFFQPQSPRAACEPKLRPLAACIASRTLLDAHGLSRNATSTSVAVHLLGEVRRVSRSTLYNAHSWPREAKHPSNALNLVFWQRATRLWHGGLRPLLDSTHNINDHYNMLSLCSSGVQGSRAVPMK